MSQSIKDEDMDSLRHMLGVSKNRSKNLWGFRNYFAAGSDQIESMERLVSAGYAARGVEVGGSLTYYHATEAGMDAVGMSKAAKRRAMEP